MIRTRPILDKLSEIDDASEEYKIEGIKPVTFKPMTEREYNIDPKLPLESQVIDRVRKLRRGVKEDVVTKIKGRVYAIYLTADIEMFKKKGGYVPKKGLKSVKINGVSFMVQTEELNI